VIPVAVVPIDSSNSIALRGDAGSVARFAAMARELDQQAALGTEIRVHWLDYANAEDMLPVIQTLLGQSAVVGAPVAAANGGDEGGGEGATASSSLAIAGPGGTTVLNGLGGRGPAVVTRFEGANAVIVAANPDTQRMIGELIRQLDRRQEQVLVEAIIVEISDSLARELGVQFLFGGEDAPFAVTNFSNVTPRILDVAGGLLAGEIDETTTIIDGDRVTTSNNSATGDFLRQNAAQAILGARGGFGGFLATLGGNLVLGALINAVQADTDSNVLSTPSLTVNNNLTGHILFGQEIPVSTGEALSSNFDNAFRTIQRQNVGIELEVTPQITAGNEVRLVINQEVSSIVGPVSDDFNELIINKREINTTVTVGDGEILALGGLLDDNERRTIQRVPILGDIPIIGELFRSRARSRVKTNLMVFIRPQILRNRADAREMTARRYGYLRNQLLLRNPDVEPSIDSLIRDYLGTNPPAVERLPDDAVYGTPVPPPAGEIEPQP
ncbi:MAG: type II secretion system protein GspD, partial [Sphingomonadales bacterium]|nr:type II secretion system protein GspD [Sphingomonadales bacterium]